MAQTGKPAGKRVALWLESTATRLSGPGGHADDGEAQSTLILAVLITLAHFLRSPNR
jgi:hypothetical protein